MPLSQQGTSDPNMSSTPSGSMKRQSAAQHAGSLSPTPGSKPSQFSDEEVMCLIDGVRKYSDVIFSPNYNIVQNRFDKQDAWMEITNLVNAVRDDPEWSWTVTQVREKWKSLLKVARKDYGIVKEAAQRFTPAPDIRRFSELVWDVCGSSIVPRKRNRRGKSAKLKAAQALVKSASKKRPKPIGRSTPISDPGPAKTPKIETSTPLNHASVSGHHMSDPGSSRIRTQLVNRSREPERLSELEEACEDAGPSSHNISISRSQQHMKPVAVKPHHLGQQQMKDRERWQMVQIEESSSDEDGEEMVVFSGVDMTDEEMQELSADRIALKSSKVMNGTKDVDPLQRGAGDADHQVEDTVESMQKRLLRVQIAKATLQKTKIESELEKIDMEKEKIALEKQKLELEMFLIRQKLNNVCSLKDSRLILNRKFK